MDLGGLAAQSAAPIVAKILLEDDVVFEDNALRSELVRARGSLPAGSYFSISSCSRPQHPWEYLSSNPASLCPESGLEGIAERVNPLVTSLFSAFAEIAGVTACSFTGDSRHVQKWIILVKNSNSNTTIGKTRYLSAILRKCMEENCLLLRIDSSNPCKVTGLVDGSMIQGAFCARMEGSAWGWLGEKAIDYMAELRRMAAAATVAGAGAAGGGAAAEADQPALTVQSDQALEEDLLAIAKGKGAQTL